MASVQTLIRRDKPPARLVVIDECHHAPAESYRSILQAYPGVPRLGLTATPFRTDGRGLGDLFGALVVAATTGELCDAGILHRPKVYASRFPDLRGVKILAGDYGLDDLAQRTNTEELNADVVLSWVRLADGLRTVCFCVNRNHSQAVAAAFTSVGIPAEHLDGTMPEAQRQAILDRLASGRTLIVCNCLVLAEGWDLPQLQAAIVVRPTISTGLHIQIIGRVMRACPGKTGAIVLDCAGNHHVHGLVTRPLNYSLDTKTRVGQSEPLGLRRCRGCGLLYELHLRQCPECQWKPDLAERLTPEIHGPGQLVEFNEESFEYRQAIWNLIEAERQAMGYREGWSVFRYRERFGVPPVVAAGELVDVGHAEKAQKQAVYQRLLQVAAQRGFKPGWASHAYRQAFGCWPRGFVAEVRDSLF